MEGEERGSNITGPRSATSIDAFLKSVSFTLVPATFTSSRMARSQSLLFPEPTTVVHQPVSISHVFVFLPH